MTSLGWSADDLHKLAYALRDLTKLRLDHGVDPGAEYERPRISFKDDTLVLCWVDDADEWIIEEIG